MNRKYRKFKWWFYDHYAAILLLGLIVTVALLILYVITRESENLDLVFVIGGGLFSFFFFVQKQQLEELQSFKALFEYYNARYDKLNETLNGIVSGDDKKDLTEAEKKALNDYFNLCGEEFLYYTKGFIYPEVWMAWCNGMAFYLENKRISDLWTKEEIQAASYYGLNRSEIQKYASRRTQ